MGRWLSAAARSAEAQVPTERKARAARRRTNRGALLVHLPRVDMALDERAEQPGVLTRARGVGRVGAKRRLAEVGELGGAKGKSVGNRVGALIRMGR